MKQYEQERKEQNRRATVIGVILTAALHLSMLIAGVFLGLSYLYPPPPETAFVVDFSEQVPKPMRTAIGRQPRAEEVDRSQSVDLVQKSESPYEGKMDNDTPATPPDETGDIEVPSPPVKEEPKLDPRASFPGMSDHESASTSPHSADKASDSFKAGQNDGNTSKGRTEGVANAHLKGRNVVGNLPRPAYTVQKEGIVVVQVKVDQYGNVTEALPGVEGTTVTDRTLWNEARKAAMEARFNMSADAPVIQVGTITYRFKLL